MIKTFSGLLVVLALFVGAGHARAEDAPAAAAAAPADSTPEEAMAWSKKAAAYVKEHGAAAATAEFNNPKGQFIKNDLYVFVVDNQGVFLAHPIKPALVGTNQMSMKDVDGTPLVRNFTEVKDEAWSPYKWPHPLTKKIRPKKSYIINVPGIPGGYFVGVGTYYEDGKK
jgi:cytochrome c